jgi:hypothetical protein
MQIRVNGEQRTVDLSKMTRSSLVELRDKPQEELVQVKIQLDNAKANVHTSGQYADAGWYASAMAARRLKGQQLQRIQTELGKRRREVNNNVERAFIEIARIRLHPDTFQDFMDEANDRVRQDL